MSKIFYHFDDDGKCAAAIVKRELISPFDNVTKEDFFEYDHAKYFEVPEINWRETVYIVDIALDDNIVKLLDVCSEKKCKVIHIDHHKSGIDYYDEHSMKHKYPLYTRFFHIGVSGTLLTWIYSMMNEEQRRDPESVPFDFSDDWTHFALYPDSPSKLVEYYIPPVIMYIDDNDVFRNNFDETKYFTLGFSIEEDKHPLSKTWDDFIYNDASKVFNAINNGVILSKYQENMNKRVMHNTHVEYVYGFSCLCVNTPFGNSRIFGDKFKEYDVVCKYSFNGRDWVYTFYSNDTSPSDVSIIVKNYAREYEERVISAGGHRHAAGMVVTFNVFNVNLID